MKLSALHEAKYSPKVQTSTLERTFAAVRRSLPNVALNDLAFYCALLGAEHMNEDYRIQDFVEILMNGRTALKNNPQAISEDLENYYDNEDEDPESFGFMVEDIIGTLKKHANDL